MVMLWLFIVLVVIAVAAVIAVLVIDRRSGTGPKRFQPPWRRRGAEQVGEPPRRLANSASLFQLPAVRQRIRAQRWLHALLAVMLVSALLSAAAIAGRPVRVSQRSDALANRDIVLCLDVSTSMVRIDSSVLTTFSEILEDFDGERVGLVAWNSAAQTIVPLTDDYEMANDVLTEMADKIDRGFNQIGNKIYLTRELEAYLQPTFSGPDDQRGSLVGDGLASCVLGFDHTDKKRSRTILLATDNEVFGEGIYNLAESIEFAKSQGVTVSVLYPGSSYSLKAEGVELQEQVKSTGGSFYDASSPSAVDEVVRQIESEQKEELDSAGKLVETDRPGAALGWTIVGVLSLLGLLAFGRL